MTEYEYTLIPEASQSDVIDVGREFRIWTMFGVVISAFELVHSLLGFLFLCTQNSTHARWANCFLILGYFLSAFWLVWGTVVRSGGPGRLCSGDELYFNEKDIDFNIPDSYSPYLLRTGQLMSTLLIVMYCFYGCLCCCGMCACVAVACGYRRELM